MRLMGEWEDCEEDAGEAAIWYEAAVAAFMSI